MRHIAGILFAAGFIFITSLARADSPNLLSNAGFEYGNFTDWEFPTSSGNEIPDRGVWEITSQRVHSGSYAASNKAINLNRLNYYATIWQESIPVSAGDIILLSAWIKPFFQEDESGQVVAGLAIGDWGAYGPYNIASTSINKDFNCQWNYLKVTAIAPSNDVRASLFVSDGWAGSAAVSGSTVYFDDISLSVIPEPSTILMFLSGIFGVFWFRKKK